MTGLTNSGYRCGQSMVQPPRWTIVSPVPVILYKPPGLMVDTHGGPGSDGYVYIYLKVRSLTAVLYGGKMYPRLMIGRSHTSQRALMVYGHSQIVMSMQTYVPPAFPVFY
jgi:hypothetical protein